MPTWLIKSEPTAYSFDQLLADTRTSWTGVRNYAARNHLRAMKKGDLALFYHSSTDKAVVGIATVVGEGYVEDTDEGDWTVVDFAPVKRLGKPVTLDAMREHPSLQSMVIWKQTRLSVVPVTQAEFDVVVKEGTLAPEPRRAKQAAPRSAQSGAAPPSPKRTATKRASVPKKRASAKKRGS